jgi:hypothetical protein
MFHKRGHKGAQAPIAGWYEDPSDASVLRFWDGSQWTDKSIRNDSGDNQSVSQDLKYQAKSIAESHLRESNLRAQQENLAKVNNELERILNKAMECAAAGNITGEERNIATYLATAKNAGGSAALKNAEQRLQNMTTAKRLRIGSELIGTVKREHGLMQYARLEKLDQVKTGGKTAVIYSDRIFHGHQVYEIDSTTGAQVTIDGIAQITQRPTLTRMALLSPLPGTALIPGLALQKKKTNDLRIASFIVASSKWSFTIPISPDEISKPREIAERINRIAAHLESLRSDLHDQESVQTQMSNPILQELKDLQQLIESGLISAEEAQSLKNQIFAKNNGGN